MTGGREWTLSSAISHLGNCAPRSAFVRTYHTVGRSLTLLKLNGDALDGDARDGRAFH